MYTTMYTRTPTMTTHTPYYVYTARSTNRYYYISSVLISTMSTSTRTPRTNVCTTSTTCLNTTATLGVVLTSHCIGSNAHTNE